MIRSKYYPNLFTDVSYTLFVEMPSYRPFNYFNFLEPVCKIRKEEKRGDCYHGREIGSPFLITSGDASELLKTIDKAFDNIAFAIK